MLIVLAGERMGHLGLYGASNTLTAAEHYFNMPDEMQDRDIIVVDPVLGTGNSASAAVERLKELPSKSIRLVCLLACPATHPGVPIYTAAIDRELDSNGYILSGPGHAGDRTFGTKQKV